MTCKRINVKKIELLLEDNDNTPIILGKDSYTKILLETLKAHNNVAISFNRYFITMNYIWHEVLNNEDHIYSCKTSEELSNRIYECESIFKNQLCDVLKTNKKNNISINYIYKINNEIAVKSDKYDPEKGFFIIEFK